MYHKLSQEQVKKEGRREKKRESKPAEFGIVPQTTIAGFRDSERGAAQPCGRETSDVGKRKASLTVAGFLTGPCLLSPGSLSLPG